MLAIARGKSNRYSLLYPLNKNLYKFVRGLGVAKPYS